MSHNTRVADTLCEFFEVLIHNILFRRKLYPETIFVAKRKYGVAVYQSIHPDVNEYINQSLKSVRFHAKKNRLQKLFLCFHTEADIFEQYVFDVVKLNISVESDNFLVDLEQSMRSFVLKLYSSRAYLDDLPEDCTFSIRLQTTALSNLEFNQEPCYENFPWIEITEKDNQVDSSDIIPINCLETDLMSVQMYIEKKVRCEA